jgi:DNA-binding Lrp family transcriptional regulator
LKATELRLIAELVRNCRASDRELAKVLNVSQPTVSRMRKRLEGEGIIEYSGIPNLSKLGYEIIAVTFAKRNFAKYPENLIHVAKDFVMKHPNIIFCADGEGLNFDVVSISIHKSYSDYSRFLSEAKAQAGETAHSESFLINTSSEGVVQPLSMRRFADALNKDDRKR